MVGEKPCRKTAGPPDTETVSKSVGNPSAVTVKALFGRRVSRGAVERLVELNPHGIENHGHVAQHRRDDVGGGVVGDIGRAGGARGADRLDPVVARRLRGEAGVRIGRHDLAVFHRVVAGLERREGVLGAVGRDLDQVALDPRANFARRDPGEVDLRGGVALHGIVRRRGEPGRRAGEDGVNVRVVVRLHGVARGVVAVNVPGSPARRRRPWDRCRSP